MCIIDRLVLGPVPLEVGLVFLPESFELQVKVGGLSSPFLSCCKRIPDMWQAERFQEA